MRFTIEGLNDPQPVYGSQPAAPELQAEVDRVLGLLFEEDRETLLAVLKPPTATTALCTRVPFRVPRSYRRGHWHLVGVCKECLSVRTFIDPLTGNDFLRTSFSMNWTEACRVCGFYSRHADRRFRYASARCVRRYPWWQPRAWCTAPTWELRLL